MGLVNSMAKEMIKEIGNKSTRILRICLTSSRYAS